MKSKYDPYNNPIPINAYGYYGEHGHSTQYVDCPICGHRRIMVYIWSFSGCGKKCPTCGSLLTWKGAIRNILFDTVVR